VRTVHPVRQHPIEQQGDGDGWRAPRGGIAELRRERLDRDPGGARGRTGQKRTQTGDDRRSQ
jgi:hypothetical protein